MVRGCSLQLVILSLVTLFVHRGLPRLNDEPKLNANKKFDEYTRNWPSHLDDTKLGEGSRVSYIVLLAIKTLLLSNYVHGDIHFR